MTDETKRILVKVLKSGQDVVIVDVMNYLYRYFYVHHDLSVNINGIEVPTGHLYGFTRLMITLKKRLPNAAIILALDGDCVDRHAEDPGYKANREHSGTNIRAYIEELKDMCSLLPDMYSCYHEDYEADDVAYAVTLMVDRLCDRHGMNSKIYILSNDKDLSQCVISDRVTLIRKLGSGEAWLKDAEKLECPQDVSKLFEGVSPEGVPIYRALIGDSSDNLKGYPRFRKAMAALISQNYSVDENLDLVPKTEVMDKKILEAVKGIKENRGIFRKNYKIMKLRNFSFDLETLGVSRLQSGVLATLKYKMKWYRSAAIMASPYKKDILEMVDTFS